MTALVDTPRTADGENIISRLACSAKRASVTEASPLGRSKRRFVSAAARVVAKITVRLNSQAAMRGNRERIMGVVRVAP